PLWCRKRWSLPPEFAKCVQVPLVERVELRHPRVVADLRRLVGFDHDGQMLEARIVEQSTEPCQSNVSVANVFVPIDPAAQRALRVVGMDDSEALEADNPIEGSHRLSVAVIRGDVVSGREQVAGVEAHANARRAIETIEDGREVLESMPDR